MRLTSAGISYAEDADTWVGVFRFQRGLVQCEVKLEMISAEGSLDCLRAEAISQAMRRLEREEGSGWAA